MQFVFKKRRHGLSRTSTYKCWKSMMTRCHGSANDPLLERAYRSRGITVCKRWQDSVAAFIEDMGERPSLLHSIDRIDNLKGYEPGNCRWATKKEQSRNRRNNTLITAFGKTLTISGWAEEKGVSRNLIICRLRRGWEAQRAISSPSIPLDAPRGKRGPCKPRVQRATLGL